MAESILNGKRILTVDDEPDILEVLEEEVLRAAPKCSFDKAFTYEDALKKIESQSFDVVVLDIMGVRGFDLLSQAVNRGFQVAMLTAHSFNPASLKRSIEMGARAYLPKEKLGEIVPFLEDILKETDNLSGWMYEMKKLDDFLISRWGGNWQKADAEFWKGFAEKTANIKL
jgi:DNA-binding response OmpR family regulator